MTISFRLPYPPSMNHYWRRVGNKTIISRGGREYRVKVVSLLADFSEPLQGPLKIVISLRPPDRRRRDVDNVLKPMLDAIQHGGVYVDDSQIVDLQITKGEPAKDGFVDIQLERV
jgi:crossover junction endodeoxyribonuclease RusA